MRAAGEIFDLSSMRAAYPEIKVAILQTLHGPGYPHLCFTDNSQASFTHTQYRYFSKQLQAPLHIRRSVSVFYRHLQTRFRYFTFFTFYGHHLHVFYTGAIYTYPETKVGSGATAPSVRTFSRSVGASLH